MTLHVDYEFRWQNFKAFKDTGWIRIRPLTILLGPNNSGKTSVITPILLLIQTFQSPDAHAALVTDGPLVEAGNFADLIHNHDTSETLSFGFGFHVHRSSEVRKLSQLRSTPPGVVEATFRGGQRPENLALTGFRISDVHMRPLLERSRLSSGKYSFTYHLPGDFKARELKVIRETMPMNFFFSPAATMSSFRGNADDEKPTNLRYSRAFSEYLFYIGATAQELSRIFYDISYVGPLRERPQRHYDVTSERPRSVGTRGQHMANLIRSNLPRLRNELDGWIKRFEFGSRLEVKDLSDEIFSLSFRDLHSPLKTNITAAGFGASQVLPLIVQALSAEADSLTIAEQPEIHLNPRLQALLADLLAYMANADQRVIVETHSEHLVLRLRHLIAAGAISNDKVAIYFVEKQKGVSTIRSLPVQENGHIASDEWPKGFFDDSLRGALALASAQARRSNQKKKSQNARK